MPKSTARSCAMAANGSAAMLIASTSPPPASAVATTLRPRAARSSARIVRRGGRATSSTSTAPCAAIASQPEQALAAGVVAGALELRGPEHVDAETGRRVDALRRAQQPDGPLCDQDGRHDGHGQPPPTGDHAENIESWE